MNSKSKKFGLIALALVIVFLATYKPMVAHKISAMFRKEGLDTITLSVDSFGFRSATFKNITIGDEAPLHIAQADMEYTLSDLWEHRFNSLVIDTMTVDADITEHGVSVHGLDGAIKELIPSSSSALLPQYFFDQTNFFFYSLRIKNGTLNLHTNNEVVAIPFAMDMEKNGQLLIELGATDTSGEERNAALSDRQLSAILSFTAESHEMGSVEFCKAGVPYEDAPLFNIIFNLQHIEIAKLFPILIGSGATGTGFVSGTLTTNLTNNGNMFFSHALLTTNKDGNIAIPEQFIHTQDPLSKHSKREGALQNFYYNHMKINADRNTANMFSVHFNLNGNNPDASLDQPLKLNALANGNASDCLQKSAILALKRP